MFTSVRVEGYRGLGHGDLNDFRALNVFVGPNGSGKSALLESIFLAASESAGALAHMLDLRQETDPYHWMFFSGKSEFSVELGQPPSEDHDGNVRFKCKRSTIGQDELLITLASPRGQFSDHFSLPKFRELARQNGLAKSKVRFVEAVRPRVSLPNLYTEVVQAGLRSSIFELVSALIPGAEGLEILTSVDGKPELNVVFAHRAAPVSTLGDGLHTLIRQSLELASSPGGVVLMEEPEALKHPAAISRIASAILASCKRGTQIFLSTHSLELIDSLLSASDGDLEEIAVYRLRLDDGSLASSRLGGADARELRSAIEEDLR